MAISSKVGTFQAQSGSGTQAINGLGFQPDFIIFGCSAVTSIDSDGEGTVAEATWCKGCTDGQSNASMSIVGQDGGNTARSVVSNTLCIGIPTTSSTWVRSAAISSMDSDGFTVDWQESGDQIQVQYLAIKGIANISFHEDASLGTSETFTPGFQADLVLCFGCKQDSLGFDSFDRRASFGFGWAVGTADDDQHSIGARLRSNGNNASALIRGSCLNSSDDSTDPEWQGHITSITSTQFTFELQVGGAAEGVGIFVALQDGDWEVGVDNLEAETGSDGADQTLDTGVSEGAAALLIHANLATNLGTDPEFQSGGSPMKWGSGMMTVDDQTSVWAGGTNGSNRDTVFSDVSVFLSKTNDLGSPSADGEAQFLDINSNGDFVIDWIDVPSNAIDYAFLVFGPPESGIVSDTDTLTLTETIAIDLSTALSDTLTITESEDVLPGGEIQEGDTLVLTEGNPAFGFDLHLSDTLTITESDEQFMPDFPTQTIAQYTEVAEWEITGVDTTGAPTVLHDVEATVVFTHRITLETATAIMFLKEDDGDSDKWAFRFRAKENGEGTWDFETFSDDSVTGLSDLHGLIGAVEVTASTDRGDIIADGHNTMWEGTNEKIVMKMVMEARPCALWPIVTESDAGDIWEGFWNHDTDTPNTSAIDGEIDRFIRRLKIDGSGDATADADPTDGCFTGFHIPLYGEKWNHEAYSSGQHTAPYPGSGADIDTIAPDWRMFKSAETILTRVHTAGGHVNFLYGGDPNDDNQETDLPVNDGIVVNSNNTPWGGTAARRMRRYVVARFAAYPGWTMGLGFDIDELGPEYGGGDTETSQMVENWITDMKSLLDYWQKLLSARSKSNPVLTQWTTEDTRHEYEALKPRFEGGLAPEQPEQGYYDYADYIQDSTDSAKPQLSGDKHRRRPPPADNRNKDYNDQTIDSDDYGDEISDGMCYQHMSPVVGAIYGNLDANASPGDSGVPYVGLANEGQCPSNSMAGEPGDATARQVVVGRQLRIERFWRYRMSRTHVVDNTIGDFADGGSDPGAGELETGCVALKDSSIANVVILYEEKTSIMGTLDLSLLTEAVPAIAVDVASGDAYAEESLGLVDSSTASITLPYESDWLIAIGPDEDVGFSETLEITETSDVQFVKVVTDTDTLALTETITINLTMIESDTLTITESDTYDRTLASSDVLTLTESVSIEIGLARSESLTITESTPAIVEGGGNAFTEDLSDTLSIAEAQAQAIGLEISETLALTESEDVEPSGALLLSDTLQISETIQIARTVSLEGTLQASDAAAKGLAAFTAEALTITEAPPAIVEAGGDALDLGDTLQAAESIALNFMSHLSETLSLSDVSARTPMPLAETLTLTETSNVLFTAGDLAPSRLLGRSDTISLHGFASTLSLKGRPDGS